MITQEDFDMYMQSLKDYIDIKTGSKYIKVGYISMHYGVWYSREGDKTINVQNSKLISTDSDYRVPPPQMTITDTYVYIGDYMFQYNTVYDKVTYFAQGTIDDLRLTKIEDFEVIREFFTAVTGYDFK